MYRVIIMILVSLLVSSQGFAEGSYKGHYRVSKPINTVDIDSLDNEINKLTANNAANKSTIQKPTNKDKEITKLKNQIKDLQSQNNEIQKNLDSQAEALKQEELKKAAIERERETITHGTYTSEDLKNKKNKYTIENEYKDLAKNKSTNPVDRTRIITNDRYIVGILENTVDTQLGGRAVIVVEQNIYGGEGRAILLPKGSRMVCQYQPLEDGQTRVPIECVRILRPDGVSISLTNAYVADQMGSNGAVGKIDNRLVEKYGQALAVSGISGLNTYTSFMLSLSQNPNLVAAAPILQSTNNTLSEVTKKILEKTMSLAPIIKVAKGSRVTLMPLVDIYIKDPNEPKSKETDR